MEKLVGNKDRGKSSIASDRSRRAEKVGRFAVAAMFVLTPMASSAEGNIKDILGDAIIECRGAIAWNDGSGTGTPRVEALQIATTATDDADRIILYAAEKDTTPQDAMACASGICTSHLATETGATTSVLRLVRGLDYGSGRVQYDLDAAFTIVSFASGSMVAETATGRGGFICDAALPTAIAAGE
ncbi:hypothetical protein [Tropicimonas sediminicola]|uniref:Uncharacterized protein n=1 Tax=Tropicimonas sediminicola TaxID=1031541 RepID=A0A239MER3_9RHOB|nr:hypothetical protein [Tropicimonas sediminicola]SNT41166.1 hypothetical protein SAMN05421757_11810 [Tropicimonas sediminicola]